MFNDRAAAEKPVARCDNSLFGRGSVAWRVHGDVTTMMVGGITGLLLQMLHPSVLAGVWDHSNFRSDMHGRLRRTARFIALTTYGDPEQARAAIARVNAIHSGVTGSLPDGTPYQANDPGALAWVHVTEATCFLAAWVRYAEPGMSKADRNRYFAEMAQIARALGADPVPTTEAEAHELIKATRPKLHCDARTREVARLVLSQQAPNLVAEPLRAMTVQASIDLLPAWAQQMHGLHTPMLAKPAIRASALAAAQLLRWTLR
jgi:uncharacterized protein (DUF2236 family)